MSNQTLKRIRSLLRILFLFYLPLSSASQEIQWATTVVNYSSQKGTTEYSALQALGEPNSMPSKGYSATAWEAATDDRKEFLHVGFAKPMKIMQVIIAENFHPGAVYKVTLYDEAGKMYDVYKEKADTLDIFSRFLQIKFEETTYNVKEVMVRFDCRIAPGMNQIDAIGIAAHHENLTAEVKVASDVKFYSKAEKLSGNINSEYTEVNPIISPDGKTLFVNRKDYPPNNADDEIWYSVLQSNGEWGKLLNMGTPLNNANHNFVNSVTPDGNTMLLGNEYYADPNAWGSGFSITRRTAKGWSFPQNARIKNFVNTDRYVNFFLTNDGRRVLMNIAREDTRGSSDLYVSFLQPDGSWSESKSLGNTINSTGSECCAFMASDGVTLYFSSDGYNTYGSNDIFMSRRLDDTWQKWTEPLNIGNDVNSSAWDAYFTIPAKGDYAYFVRNGDIYRIRINEEIKPHPVVLVNGIVYNQKTNAVIGDAQIHYEYLPGGNEAGIATSHPVTGEYKIVLPAGYEYGFLANEKGYLPVSDNFSAKELKEYAEIKRDLYLVPVEVGQTVRLNNIFFDFGKATLREESFPELNRVVKFLNENPNAKINITGHTDNVGSDEENLKLSDARAKAVMDYLISQKIAVTRLQSKGYGETQPVETNDREEGRQLNRRVEFTIIGL